MSKRTGVLLFSLISPLFFTCVGGLFFDLSFGMGLFLFVLLYIITVLALSIIAGGHPGYY